MAALALPPVLPRNQPLGPNPYNAGTQPAWHSAYDQCLQLQTGDPQQQLYARCLGYLLIEAIDEESRHYVAEEILLCMDDDEKLKCLGKFYIDHIFRLFRQNKGGTPTPSYHPSRGSFEIDRTLYAATVESAPRDHSAAKKAALRRDGYRCMVTGDYDSGYADTLPIATLDAHALAGFGCSRTNLAHIFPPSTNRSLNPEEEGHPKIHYSSTVWTIINCFAHINVLDELDGTQVHKLSNVLTLSADMHNHFDDLKMWFEEVPGTLNSYYVCSTHLARLKAVPNRLVTFTANDGLDLPDPRYLKLHAAVCRVAHMSGAAEYLDSYDREQEERGAMARDGTSADFLTARLHRVLLVG